MNGVILLTSIYPVIQMFIVHLAQGQVLACSPGCQEDNHIVPAFWKLTVWWWEMLPAIVLISVVKVHSGG